MAASPEEGHLVFPKETDIAQRESVCMMWGVWVRRWGEGQMMLWRLCGGGCDFDPNSNIKPLKDFKWRHSILRFMFISDLRGNMEKLILGFYSFLNTDFSTKKNLMEVS